MEKHKNNNPNETSPQTNKEKLIKGLYQMALAFPFIFAGPSLFFWKGAKAWEDGQYLWTIISVVLMLGAAVMVVLGLRKVLAAFFDQEP